MRAAGLCQAIVLALRNHAKNVHGQVLKMLSTFLTSLIPKSTMAEFAAHPTIADLVAGGVVEYAVENAVERMDVAECDRCHAVANLLFHFSNNPGGLERMSTRGTVDRLMMAIGKWLLGVRAHFVVAILGSRD